MECLHVKIAIFTYGSRSNSSGSSDDSGSSGSGGDGGSSGGGRGSLLKTNGWC